MGGEGGGLVGEVSVFWGISLFELLNIINQILKPPLYSSRIFPHRSRRKRPQTTLFRIRFYQNLRFLVAITADALVVVVGVVGDFLAVFVDY